MKKILKFGVLTMALGMVAAGVSVTKKAKEITPANAETLNEITIAKESFNKNNAVVVNAVNAAQNRYSINIFLRANDYCDAPVAQIENNPAVFSGQQSVSYDTTMSASDYYERARALNIFQGNLLIDQQPVTAYSRSSLGFWDNPFGRCYLGKNGDNHFQLHIDVCTNFASGYHSIILKKGTQIPTFAYFTNTDTAKYTKNTVLVMPETVVWQVNSSLGVTWIGTTEADKTMVSKVGFSVKGTNAIYENTTATRSAFYFDLVSYYSVYGTNSFSNVDKYSDVNQYSNNFHLDYHDPSASDCRSATHKAGALHTLRFWDHVLIDDKPAYTDWNDSRVQHTNAGALGTFGRIGLSFVFKNVTDCKTKDTVTVTFLKGIEIPTPTDRFADKAEYMTTDVSYKFTFKAIQNATVSGGQKSFNCTGCEVIDTEAWDNHSSSTEVISAHMVQHSGNNSNGRLVFKLSNYDFGYDNENTVKDIIKNVNEENQTPVVINQTAANYYSNILFDGESCSSKITNYKTVLGYHGVGFIANFPWNAPTVSEITIKAGTRFPAQSYCYPTTSSNNCLVSDTPTFYVTSSDVVLKYDSAQARWVRQDVIKEVQPTAVKFAINSGTTSMNLCIHLDGANYEKAGARTVNAVMRKTDNMWTGIKFDNTSIVTNRWEGTSGTYDRSSRSTVGTDGFHKFQMLGDYTNPGINEIFIPAGTYFYSSAMLDQGTGVKEIYVTKTDVTFYKYKDAVTYGTADEKASYEYATAFLNDVECDNGVTAPSVAVWTQKGTDFAELSSGAKAMIVGAAAKTDGTNIEKAVARYDYIIAKYGTTNYANFMSRAESSVNPNIARLTSDSNNNIAIICIISVVSVSLLGALIVTKKRTVNK